MLIIFFAMLHPFHSGVSEYLCEMFGKLCKWARAVLKGIYCSLNMCVIFILISNIIPLYNTCIGRWVVDVFRYIKSDLKFSINGKVTVSSCSVRKDKLEHVSYRRLKKHFNAEVVV